MQGVVFMPQNPQQGSPPPNNTLVTDIVTMETSSEPNDLTKEKQFNNQSNNQNDSGIYSITNSTINSESPMETTMNTTLHSDNCDNYGSDCSRTPSPPTTTTTQDEEQQEKHYICPICDKTLLSQHEFTLHIRSHNNETITELNHIDNDKGFTCRICYKVLSSSSSLDRHVLVHSGERPFHCKYCGDTFTTNGNMHRHMRTHSNNNISNNNNNNNKFDNYESDGSIDSSLSTNSKNTEFNNNINTKLDRIESRKRKFEEDDDIDGDYDENQFDNDQQIYKCPVCERNDFNSIKILETHLEDNHPDYPVKCNQCNQILQNHKMLTIHRTTIHDNNQTKHHVYGFKDLTFVDFSSEKFPHIARYECEKNLHKVNSGLRFQCRKCSRAFPCSNSLEIHENDCVLIDNNNGLDLTKTPTTTTTTTAQLSENDIKRNEFFSRLNLQDNSPEKSNTIPPILNETSTKLRQQLLAKAMNLETTKDLADIQSIISMTTNGSLLQQLQTKNDGILNKQNEQNDYNRQTNDQQEEETQDLFAVEFRKMKLRGEFPCRLCTAVFPNLRALKGHNRAHLNSNNNGMYRCNMCPHSSIDKAALIRHMRTHNGDRPYECSLCNYAFTTKANCERHLRNRHAKSTREEVKKSIIYHPSEDPTNEDLNKLARDDRKLNLTSGDSSSDLSTEKLVTKRNNNDGFIPNLLKETLQKDTKIFHHNITDIIRNENIKSLKDHSIENGQLSPYLPQYNYSPKNSNISTPTTTHPPSKIQVKSLEALKEPNFDDNHSDSDNNDNEDEPMVLDLSKKRIDEEIVPEDLSRKSLTPPSLLLPPPPTQLNMGEIFAQQLLKTTPPKIDPAALYATQLALARNSFASFGNWPGFPINHLLFQSLQQPILSQDTQDIKERLQRYQLCGGGNLITDNFTERLKSLQNFPNYKLTTNDTKEKIDDLKPLNIDTNYNENLNVNLQSPVAITKQQPDLVQSPNSVKMVIKNGVLMPKQKQRRYRTERPFTCEHCSARFTLRSNMERHIKQQHPQFWSQRQRGLGTPGRKIQTTPVKGYCDINIPNYESQKSSDMDDTTTLATIKTEQIDEKLKFALLSQHLQANNDIKKEEEDDCALIIDENLDKEDKNRILEDKLRELHAKQLKNDSNKLIKQEENQDLVSVSRLLDNASQQQFKEYFKREGEEQETGGGSEEDEEGLIASGSTSEGNISGTDENRSESEAPPPVKKKSAYSMAPNRVSCPFCSRKFPWSSSLRRHILTHTGQKPFKCSHCPLLFTTKSNCDRHLLRKHGNSATTIINDITNNNNNNNNANYLMRNVPERPFKCSNCPSSTFSTYSNLKKHISCKHSTNAQGDDIRAQGYEAGSSEDEKLSTESLQQPQQQQKTTNEWNDNQINHIKTETIITNSDLPFKCHLCDGSFSDRQDALDHIKDKHFSEYDLLMSKNALDSTATVPTTTPATTTTTDDHHNEDEENDIRGKFPDYSNRKVICAFCMRRFWSAEDLRRHMRTHTGERPFSCDICRRRFTLKHSMLRHRKKHNVNFDHDNCNNSDDDNLEKYSKGLISGGGIGGGDNFKHGDKTEESDGNEGGDLISNLLGIRDRSFIDKVLTASPDDVAKLLGVKNGIKE